MRVNGPREREAGGYEGIPAERCAPTPEKGTRTRGSAKGCGKSAGQPSPGGDRAFGSATQVCSERTKFSSIRWRAQLQQPQGIHESQHQNLKKKKIIWI